MPAALPIRTVLVTRYVTPLREGGSLPAIAEADDGFLYALKFRGAGQGPKALIAELIGGEICRRIGLHVPEIVFAELDEAFGRTEPDEEIQDLLRASEGLNLALHYLSGAVTFDPAVRTLPANLASKIVWLDAYLMNVDRTARNTNMLWWQHELWLIDHGAALYFHHSWADPATAARNSFPLIKDHVLLAQAAELNEAGEAILPLLTDEWLESLVQAIPESWLLTDAPFTDVNAHRAAYKKFLTDRRDHSAVFINEAKHARR